MPTYVYETIPSGPTDPVRRFEIWQRMRDPVLTHHPTTGEPIRRTIVGGIGMPGSITDAAADGPGGPLGAKPNG
jgi:predicted nucleic acid-binding Zn ribbon protein